MPQSPTRTSPKTDTKKPARYMRYDLTTWQRLLRQAELQNRLYFHQALHYILEGLDRDEAAREMKTTPEKKNANKTIQAH